MKTARARRGHHCRVRGRLRLNCSMVRRVLLQGIVNAIVMVQVDNSTPIVPSRDKSVIHGIRGSVVLWSCMRSSSSKGTRCVDAVSRRRGTVDP